MLTRMLTSGLLAGVIAGICVAIIQLGTTAPLIHEAERYEDADPAMPAHASHQTDRLASEAHVQLAHMTGDHHALPQRPADVAPLAPFDPSRAVKAAIADIGAAVGFALMLIAAMVASRATITTRSALLWGACGFIATGLAPAFGLAPELPGSAAADLVLRQGWWIATVGATAVALWGLWRFDKPGPIVGCVALLAAPHIFGAPHADVPASHVPAELAGQFAATSLGVQAILWAIIGALSGYFWCRFEPDSPRAGASA